MNICPGPADLFFNRTYGYIQCLGNFPVFVVLKKTHFKDLLHLCRKSIYDIQYTAVEYFVIFLFFGGTFIFAMQRCIEL